MILCFALALSACEKMPGAGTAGADSAPDFTLSDLSGKQYGLKDFRGKAVVLEFWASWCGPCKMAVPEFNKLSFDLAEFDAVFISVSVDRYKSDIVNFIAKNKLEYPVLYDDKEVNKNYAVSSIPTTVIIGRDGRILNRHTGFFPGMGEHILREVKEYSEKNVRQPQ